MAVNTPAQCHRRWKRRPLTAGDFVVFDKYAPRICFVDFSNSSKLLGRGCKLFPYIKPFRDPILPALIDFRWEPSVVNGSIGAFHLLSREASVPSHEFTLLMWGEIMHIPGESDVIAGTIDAFNVPALPWRQEADPPHHPLSPRRQNSHPPTYKSGALFLRSSSRREPLPDSCSPPAHQFRRLPLASNGRCDPRVPGIAKFPRPGRPPHLRLPIPAHRARPLRPPPPAHRPRARRHPPALHLRRPPRQRARLALADFASLHASRALQTFRVDIDALRLVLTDSDVRGGARLARPPRAHHHAHALPLTCTYTRSGKSPCAARACAKMRSRWTPTYRDRFARIRTQRVRISH
ncbi:hypothetical protein B0H11DRAFT_1147617 [Mycena galericulata]|nr:hypothetical protein B0H11DRAFT_1147617 [Mycena galericulata]